MGGFTEARMRIDGLPAGTYNVTVFEGRTTDDNQSGKIWSGDSEPAESNTGNFAGGSGTVEVVVSSGQSVWYKHLEDNTGGVSGMIIRQTASSGGAKQLVVHEALETTSMLDSYFSWLTPITNMGASPEGAEMTTFLAPPFKWAEAASVEVKAPVDSTT